MGKFNNIQYTHWYHLDHIELEHVFEEKDLGVIMDMELNFQEHISVGVGMENVQTPERDTTWQGIQISQGWHQTLNDSIDTFFIAIDEIVYCSLLHIHSD